MNDEAVDVTIEVDGAPAIVRSEREAWLEERKHSIGCSDLAAILGEDPRRGWLSLYENKLSTEVTEDDASYLRLGRDFTGPICREYGHKFGRPVFDRGEFTIIRNPDQPRLTATLDRETEGSAKYPAPALGVGPLEAKALAWMAEDEWVKEPPMQYLIQVQGQMSCTGALWGSLAALIGGIVIARPIDILRNDGLIQVIYERIDAFWWHVENRVPPPADGLPETTRVLKRLYRNSSPGSEMTLDVTDHKCVVAWDEARKRRLKAEDEEVTHENLLRARMGTAELGRLPDQSYLVLKTTVRNPECCEKCGNEVRRGSSYRTPRWSGAKKR